MALRRGFPQGRQTRSRRQVIWGNGPLGLPLAISTTGTVHGTGVVLAAELKATIVRLRGMLDVNLLTASAVGDGFDGALGIGIVTDEAFAAGAASTPDPVTEADWDGWLYHTFFHVHAAAGADMTGPMSHFRIPIDSKAMRIWTEGNTLFPSVEVVLDGTSTAEVWFDTRLLVKLS